MVCNIAIAPVRFWTIRRWTTGPAAVNILTWYGTVLKWFARELRVRDIFLQINKKKKQKKNGLKYTTINKQIKPQAKDSKQSRCRQWGLAVAAHLLTLGWTGKQHHKIKAMNATIVPSNRMKSSMVCRINKTNLFLQLRFPSFTTEWKWFVLIVNKTYYVIFWLRTAFSPSSGPDNKYWNGLNSFKSDNNDILFIWRKTVWTLLKHHICKEN